MVSADEIRNFKFIEPESKREIQVSMAILERIKIKVIEDLTREIRNLRVRLT